MAVKAVALSVGMMPMTSPEPMPAPRNGASGCMAISCRRAFSMVVRKDSITLTTSQATLSFICVGMAGRLMKSCTREPCISGSV